MSVSSKASIYFDRDDIQQKSTRLQTCIKRIFDKENTTVCVVPKYQKQRRCRASSLPSRLSSKRQQQQQYDAFYYAHDDPWMLEIFNSKGTLPRSFIEKVICFDQVKYFETVNQHELDNFIKDLNEKIHTKLDELKLKKQTNNHI